MLDTATLNEEDRVLIRDILRARRAAGEENPLLAIDVDLNGDGITDAFGLDENDEPVVVLGAALEDTSYESEGDDIAQFAPVDLGEPLFVDEED